MVNMAIRNIKITVGFDDKMLKAVAHHYGQESATKNDMRLLLEGNLECILQDILCEYEKDFGEDEGATP